MNYLIVMPQITKIKNQYYPFPIGIAYVSASLKKAGKKVSTLNLNYKDKTIFELLKESIEKNHIDVVAVGGLTAQYPQIKEIIDCVKLINPNIIVFVGGGIITSDPIPAMEALETADFGMIGEGEITICELADTIETNGNFNCVEGIVFKQDDSWVVTNPRKEIMDLDCIPYPDYDGFEFGEVISKLPTDIYAFAGGNFATVSFGRSCPFNCTFCFHSSGSKYRQRSLNSIFEELDILISKYPIKNLAITDELFAYNIDYVREFCDRIKKYDIGFVVSLRVDIVTRELLEMLKGSGCLSVGFGLESADNRILKSMQKKITVEQIENALSLANEVGINAQGNFIFGDLEETVETANNTINWWLAHPEYQIALHWIVVYPGSYLYKVACERGIIKDKVQYIKDGCPYINVSKLSDDEYKNVALKIDTLQLDRVDKLTDVKIVQKDRIKVDVTGKCPKCGFENTFTNLDVFRPLSNTVCINCNKVINLLVADYIDDSFDKNIKKIVSENKVALWPMTNVVTNMFSSSKSLRHDNVYIIDSSQFKQGNIFMGKTINSPEIISKMDISVVIITLTTSVANEIIEIVKKEYPNVKKIILASELVNSSYSIDDIYESLS